MISISACYYCGNEGHEKRVRKNWRVVKRWQNHWNTISYFINLNLDVRYNIKSISLPNSIQNQRPHTKFIQLWGNWSFKSYVLNFSWWNHDDPPCFYLYCVTWMIKVSENMQKYPLFLQNQLRNDFISFLMMNFAHTHWILIPFSLSFMCVVCWNFFLHLFHICEWVHSKVFFCLRRFI